MTQTTVQPAVPYTNLGRQTSELMPELLRAAERVLRSGHYVLGPEVAAFEREFADYCGTRFAVGVSNGTAALTLVLRRLDIQPGDEIITAPNSFIASAASIAMVGARPVFVDIGPDLNLDPDRVAAAVTPSTRAIMPVHLTGRPCRMDAVLDIARKADVFVLEDAAQSVGATWRGRRVGSFGEAGAFSLHPLKNLHAFGDGGVITTSDETLRNELVKARNHGLRNRDECEFWSVNSRLDEIQAAWLRVQLRHLDAWTEQRRRLAFRYHDLLRSHVEVPEEHPSEYCVYQTYMIQTNDRDALVNWLNHHGVEARVHYPIPLHLQPVAKSLDYTAQDFPAAVRAASRIISLPLYPGMSDAQQDRVAELIAEFYSRHHSGKGASV